MSRCEPETRAEGPRNQGRVRAYLQRFFTSWVAEDPEPSYSALDLSDGLGQVPDPVCQPRFQVPESAEVVAHLTSADESRSAVVGRAGR